MARPKTKPFNKSKGIYYFNVWTNNSAITIKRKSINEAVVAFRMYKRQGKRCEWLGVWDGKDFDLTGLPIPSNT